MRAVRHLLSIPLLSAALGVGACASEPQPTAPPRLNAPATVEAPVEPGPKDAVSRGSIDRAIKAGLGHFLSFLEIEAALDAKGKFVGWRVLELRGPKGTWDGVDLHAGDIVTSVNGFPIERDYQADKAFKSLGVASEIRVGLLRDGKKSELRFAILDDDVTTAATGAPKP
jgi:S1-C subfamily serine protease